MKHVAQNYDERIMWMFQHVNDHTVSSFIVIAINIRNMCIAQLYRFARNQIHDKLFNEIGTVEVYKAN